MRSAPHDLRPVAVHSFYLGCLAHASYLIHDERSKTAAVLDPQRDVDLYFAKARELGVEIRHVLLTHFHADFVAGHLEIRERSGATIHLGGAAGGVEYAHAALADGDTIEFGDTRIVAMETPGHTPEGISYVLYDATVDADQPQAVFTGDTLFVGDVGRPDLMASFGTTAEQLATQLYHSLHDKLLRLPDDTVVYPAHGAGSLCGKSLGSERSTTIGAQKRDNCSVQPMSVEQFVARVTADQPQVPKYFGHDAVLNRKNRGLLDVAVERGTTPLDVEAFLARRAAGAQVVDTRESDDFARGAVRGSVHVPLSGSFATWSGAMLELDAPVLVVAEPGREQEAAVRLGRIGLDTVIGYLDGGFAAIADRDDAVQSHRVADVAELERTLADDPTTTVLDVRTPGEFASGHIDGARNVPLLELPERIAEVPTDRTVYVVCRSGARSSTAISMLLRAGRGHDLVNVRGGMTRWNEHSAPVQS